MAEIPPSRHEIPRSRKDSDVLVLSWGGEGEVRGGGLAAPEGTGQ